MSLYRVTASGTPKAGADHYLEVGFSGGTIAPGASAGDLQLRLSKTDWSAFGESDDHSHTAGTSYADAPEVALCIGEDLAWGIEP